VIVAARNRPLVYDSFRKVNRRVMLADADGVARLGTEKIARAAKTGLAQPGIHLDKLDKAIFVV